MSPLKSLPKQERLKNKNTEEIYQELTSLEPTPVSATVPDKQNGIEQKSVFLKGEVNNPKHIYPALDNFKRSDLTDIRRVGKELLESLDEPIEREVYKDFINSYQTISKMMLAMNKVRNANSEEDYQQASEEFMRYNIEKYGEPDLATYESILTEKAFNALDKEAVGRASEIQAELTALLPETIQENIESGEIPERYKPNPETVLWMKDVVETLYGDMLKHVPNKKNFTPQETAEVFQSIIDHEFGEEAEGWRAELATARAVNVVATDKLIRIPDNTVTRPRDKVRTLVVHEIGVHMLRSITGASTDIGPLRNGLAGYYDTEEGLGMVMEQALMGEYREAGLDHYISAGAAYFDNMDFRQMFEMKWRMRVLEQMDESGEVADEDIDKARAFAYGNVMRSLRGTDELPWFKDLAYYNGSVEVWKYLDTIKGDDFQLSLLMQGKVSTSKSHQRIVLESASI